MGLKALRSSRCYFILKQRLQNSEKSKFAVHKSLNKLWYTLFPKNNVESTKTPPIRISQCSFDRDH